jgi:protein-disulfide isomerase
MFSIARIKPVLDFKELAEDTGLKYEGLSRAIYDPKIQSMLRKDIIDALKLGITGTPSFVIDGKVYQGQIPPEILKKIMD